MNMLGKILVVLIFIMSIFFMAFSFMVFMTQTNWKEKTSKAEDDLRTARQANSSLQAEITTLKTRRASDNAARTSAIALLEANLASSVEEQNKMSNDLAALRAQQQQQGAQVTGSIATLQAERDKVDVLRETVKSAHAERDKMFDEVVRLKNRVLELESTRKRLSASQTDLLAQLGQQAAVLRAHDLNPNDDISGLPPMRTGQVNEVDDKFILMSLGSDDGLRKGHTLHVHRGSKYVSKVQVTRTFPDKSVGVVLDDYRKAAIMRGDSVRTK